MAVSAATLRGRLRSTTNQSTAYTTNSTAMGANHLALAFIAVSQSSDFDLDSVSGYGVTWVDVSATYSECKMLWKTGTNGMKCHVWAALTGGGTGSGSLSVDPAGSALGMNITVVEITGDFSGASSPIDAILQHDGENETTPTAATSRTPSLPNAPDSDSRTFGYWGMNTTGNVTFDGDWTSIDNGSHSTPSHGMGVAWRSDAADQTATGSWGSNVFCYGLLLEIAEVPGAATVAPQFVVPDRSIYPGLTSL